jgi:regulator of CtrA degradation
MSDFSLEANSPISFREKLAGSQAFTQLFRDGMGLVEETAAYLDGAGRKDSKALPRTAALTYATESMRLTTRLMQLASWLLLHRAVKEGEMSLSQVNQEKTKVKLSPTFSADEDTLKVLPETLVSLIRRSLVLAEQVRRLDGATARRHHPHARCAAPQQQQPGRASDRDAESRVRAEGVVSSPFSPSSWPAKTWMPGTRPGMTAIADFSQTEGRQRPTHFFPASSLMKPENFFWNRDRRPPRSSSCCAPPVQAGCDFGSMSRCIVSPSLPQVVRVANSVPSVILTLMVW